MKRIILLISALSFLSCGVDAQKKAKPSKADKEFLKVQADGIYAKFETNRGDIYVQLEYTVVPMTVSNFVGLAEGTIKNTAKPANTPYYDGLKFHRVIPGFMIQGGCPNGNGSGDPGYSFDDEIDPNSEITKKGYVRGVMAMANRGPNTNGSQFFLMHKDYALPPSYTIFGHIVKGIEVVDTIANTPRGGNDLPNQDQTIKHIEILRKGKAAEAFDAAKVFEFEKSNIAVKAAAKAKAEAEMTTKLLNEKYGSAQTTASGMKYIVEKEGTGKSPKATDNVTVHYTGTFLTTGGKFDSSVDRGEPATFPLDRVISGWTEGLQMMKEGGKTRFVIPPNLAYGEGGRPGIPPNSWLVFDIELIKVGN